MEPYDNLTGGYSKTNISMDFLIARTVIMGYNQEERYNDIFFEHRNDSIVKHKSGTLAAYS